MDKTIKLSTGKTIKIWYSDDEGPRAWDNLGTIVAVGGYSHLNDSGKHNIELGGNYESRWDFIERGAEMVRKQSKDKVVCILPIHVYKHSGIALSTSMEYPFNCRWDSGTCGFIFVTNKDIRDNWGLKRISQKRIDHAEKILKGEIETLSQWLDGEVYGYSIEGTDDDGEPIDDSCGGFYGSDFEKNGMMDYLGGWLNEAEKEEFLSEI